MATLDSLHAPEVGHVLAGKYRVEKPLGAGGMGIVLAATDVRSGQSVALKLLRPHAAADPELVSRFVREGHAVASLKSEHVARMIESGVLPDGRPYLVMEHLQGQDLSQRLALSKPLPITEAVDYVRQACEAIAEAHAAGIVHRDLKPQNLFLTTRSSGEPLLKVLDFGISKFMGVPQEMQLTGTSEIIGSPSYMSPEQLRSSRHVDTRTDIWALGVVLYELLTGRLPFYGQNVTELIAIVLTEEPKPVGFYRPEVPPALADIVTRCLAKRLDERCASVAELVAALDAFARVELVDTTKHIVDTKQMPLHRHAPDTIAIRDSAGGATNATWSEPSVREPPRGKRAWLPFAIAIAALAPASLGGVWWTRTHPARGTPAPPMVALVAPIAPVEPPTTTAEASAAPPSVPVEAPTAIASSVARRGAPPKTAKPGASVPRPATPTPTKALDDFSDLDRR